MPLKRLIVRLIALSLIMLSVGWRPTEAAASSLGDFLGARAVTMPEPWHQPGQAFEASSVRNERLQMIADVIASEASSAVEEFGWYWSADDLALATFIKTYYESGHWDVRIHNGRVRGDHGHSTCLGQIWGGGTKLVGVDREHTRLCIVAVMKHLTFHMKRCLNEHTQPSAWAIAKVFAGYGTGHSCSESISRIKTDASGVVAVDHDGKPIKDFWARERAYNWWRLRKAWQTADQR